MLSTTQWVEGHAAATGTRITEVFLPSEGFIDEDVFLMLLPIARSTFWQGIGAGLYPKPVKLSKRKNGWSVEAVRKLFATINAQGN